MSEAELYRRLWMQAVGMRDDEIDRWVRDDPPNDTDREHAELLKVIGENPNVAKLSAAHRDKILMYAAQLRTEQWAAVAEMPRWNRMVPGTKIAALKSRTSLKHSLWFLWKLGMRFVRFLVN